MKSAVTLSLVSEATGGPFVFWHDVPTAIRAATDLGFEAMEVFAPDAATVSSLDWQTIAPNLPIAALGTGAGWVKHKLLLSDPDKERRSDAVQFVADFLKVASQHQTKVIIGSMQGRSSASLIKSEALKYLRESLELLDSQAEQLGSQLLFEPLNRYETDLANTIAEASRLIEGLGSTRILGDLFHMNIEEASIENSIRAHAELIGHIHFADSNRQAIGFGHLAVHKVCETLKEIGYTGYLSAEIIPKPNSLEAARQTIESFQKFID